MCDVLIDGQPIVMRPSTRHGASRCVTLDGQAHGTVTGYAAHGDAGQRNSERWSSRSKHPLSGNQNVMNCSDDAEMMDDVEYVQVMQPC